MQSVDKLLTLIREGRLELHCTDVKIWQCDGVELFGHGTIKINKHGLLHLDFICTSNKNLPYFLFLEKLPKDPLNNKETFYLECKTLAGDLLRASGFSIDFSFNDGATPVHKIIFLKRIECEEFEDDCDDNFLFLEFSEYCDIPANRSNSEASTLGYESQNWNQSVIEMDEFEISIVNKKEYTYVRVTGVFDVQRVLDCLKFYIGFTCGSMIQPIFTVERNQQHQVSTINSISNLQKSQRSSNPVPSIYGQKKVETEYHYKFFRKVYHTYDLKPEFFESIYSQWARVWHSFQSKNSITILTLSVAIEGLLNDIFIPKLKELGVNEHLNDEISRIKLLISQLDISKSQMDRLKGSVSYWKNITAANALDYLVNINVLCPKEKKSWSTLRNSSAHPKTKEISTSSLEAEREDLLLCLNLFHNLIFNTVGYSGPRNYFEVNCENPLKLIEHIEISEQLKQVMHSKT